MGANAVKIYAASSWRNAYQPAVVAALRRAGHEVYDFRHPQPGDDGFHWSEIDPAYETWTLDQYQKALADPIAIKGFWLDYDAMHQADACVLILPAGRSAHLEAGYFVGAAKPLYILMPPSADEFTIELMYRMARLVKNVPDLIAALRTTLPKV